MRRLYSILLLFFIACSIGYGQQLPMFSQYMFSDYLTNPALAGTVNYYQLRSNNRYQWEHVQDPPITNNLSLYGPMAKGKMGFGTSIYSDVTGPLSKNGLYASYAFNFELSREVKMSMGLSAGVFMYRLDGKKNEFLDPSDPLNTRMVETNYMPDANAGIHIYSKYFYVGLAAHQLLNNKVQFSDQAANDSVDVFGHLTRHLFLTGGYDHQFNRRYSLKTDVMVKSANFTNYQVDLSSRIEVRQRYWAGLGYRTNNVISVILGYKHQKKLIIGYSYDISIGKLNMLNIGGAHELMIGFLFNRQEYFR